MSNLTNALTTFWTDFTSVIKSFNFPVDFIDIAVVAFIIYHAVRLVRETRAMQLIKGIAAILVVYFVAELLRMITLGFFMRSVISVGIFLLVVLFQPELRSVLDKMGRTKLGALRLGGEVEIQEMERLIDILTESSVYLSSQKTGALMVVERMTKLGDVIHTGTLLDAVPSMELITNVFFTNSPLHDGAMIIRDCRLHAAGCYLPLSQNMEISRELGTRHRAALGMSEVSDAVILVISEETGAITMASDSRLQRGLSEQNLRKLLQIKLLGAGGKEEARREKTPFWRAKK